MDLTVIICAHNPRPAYLSRTLDGLRRQTLALENWELLLIDNASTVPLAAGFDLTWHPHGRNVMEPELGLTPARLRGIREAKGAYLVFVDDDNVLAEDYLEQGWKIVESMPQMKVFGGNVVGEFEVQPEAWMKPFLPLLALREVTREVWSNDPAHLGFYPCGAGMFVERGVADAYMELLTCDPRRKSLDRRGGELTSGGDDDICFTGGSLGFGVGVFPTLSLRHLIPKGRLNEDYLVRLVEGVTYSGHMLAWLWGRNPHLPRHSARWKIGYWRMRRRMSERDQRFADAKVRAEQRAWASIHEHGQTDRIEKG